MKKPKCPWKPPLKTEYRNDMLVDDDFQPIILIQGEYPTRKVLNAVRIALNKAYPPSGGRSEDNQERY